MGKIILFYVKMLARFMNVKNLSKLGKFSFPEIFYLKQMSLCFHQGKIIRINRNTFALPISNNCINCRLCDSAMNSNNNVYSPIIIDKTGTHKFTSD